MPRFAANLTMMFNEVPFLRRFDAAAEAGFEAVEFLFPYDHPAQEVGEALRRSGLAPALFNLPPGNWAAGERGMASIPGREAEVEAELERALPYIEATGVPRVHLMAGINDSSDVRSQDVFREAVRKVAGRLQPLGVGLVLEPINGRDMPGYFLGSMDAGAALVEELALPNLQLQFDLYHCQIMHGDVTRRLQRFLPLIGHVQVASVPSRNEPDGEELSYPFLFAELDRLGYDGFVGCEYRPRGGTADGLGWFAAHRPRRNTSHHSVGGPA